MVNTYAAQSGGCRFESLWGFGFSLKGAYYEVGYCGKKTFLAGLQCTLTSSCAKRDLLSSFNIHMSKKSNYWKEYFCYMILSLWFSCILMAILSRSMEISWKFNTFLASLTTSIHFLQESCKTVCKNNALTCKILQDIFKNYIFLVGAFINNRARLLQSLVFFKTDSKRRTSKLTFNY